MTATTSLQPTTAAATTDHLAYYRKALAVVAPLPFLAIGLTYLLQDVPGDAPFPTIVRDVGNHIGVVHAVSWLSFAFFGLLIPAVLAIAATTYVVRPRLTAWATTLCLPAFAIGFGLNANDTELAVITHDKHLDLTTMTALDKAWQAQAIAGIASLLFIVAVVFGLGMLGVALWRGKVIPVWAAVGFTVGAVTHPFLPGHVAQGIGLLVAAVSLTQVSRVLLSRR